MQNKIHNDAELVCKERLFTQCSRTPNELYVLLPFLRDSSASNPRVASLASCRGLLPQTKPVEWDEAILRLLMWGITQNTILFPIALFPEAVYQAPFRVRDNFVTPLYWPHSHSPPSKGTRILLTVARIIFKKIRRFVWKLCACYRFLFIEREQITGKLQVSLSCDTISWYSVV